MHLWIHLSFTECQFVIKLEGYWKYVTSLVTILVSLAKIRRIVEPTLNSPIQSNFRFMNSRQLGRSCLPTFSREASKNFALPGHLSLIYPSCTPMGVSRQLHALMRYLAIKYWAHWRELGLFPMMSRMALGILVFQSLNAARMAQ